MRNDVFIEAEVYYNVSICKKIKLTSCWLMKPTSKIIREELKCVSKISNLMIKIISEVRGEQPRLKQFKSLSANLNSNLKTSKLF